MKRKSLAILHIPRLAGQRGPAQEGQWPVGLRGHLQQALLWPVVEAAPQEASGADLGQLPGGMETAVVVEEEGQFLVAWGPPAPAGRVWMVQAVPRTPLRPKDPGWVYSLNGVPTAQGKELEVQGQEVLGELSLGGLGSGEE